MAVDSCLRTGAPPRWEPCPDLHVLPENAQALKRYCDGLVSDLEKQMDFSPGIRTTLRNVRLALAATDVSDPERGCLLVNATRARRPRQHGRTGEVDPGHCGVRADRPLERARVRGDLGAAHSPVEPARFLTTFLQGLHAMGNARADRSFLESAVSTAPKVLDWGSASVGPSSPLEARRSARSCPQCQGSQSRKQARVTMAW